MQLAGVEKGCCKSLPFEADDIEDLAKAQPMAKIGILICFAGKLKYIDPHHMFFGQLSGNPARPGS